MNAYDVVLAARGANRLCSGRYINDIVEDFMELHGDRLAGDDPAVIGGIGRIGDIAVTVIGIEKGNSAAERVAHNFGSAHPEGYRKALRLMKQAEKFHRPVLCFVDTAGAFCGIDAEEHGQGSAIATNLYEMSTLKTPIVSVIVGEGGSGGALALSHSDKIWMLSESYFSVVAPENCANILWKSMEKADEASRALKLTAPELKKMGIVDRVIQYVTLDDSQSTIKKYMKRFSMELEKEFTELLSLSTEQLLENRYNKFRKIG